MAELREVMEKEILPDDIDSYIKILNNLLDGSKNLELKTHIFKPKQLASLITFANYLKSIELTSSSIFIIDFVKDYLTKMVSYKRLSRTEIIKAVSSFYEGQKNSNSLQKLTTPIP